MEADKKPDEYSTYPIYVIAKFTALFALLGHLVFLLLFIHLEIFPLVYVNIASCLLFILIFFLNMRRRHHLVLILTFVEIIFHAFAATRYLGWSSGFHIYILCLIPLVFNYRILNVVRKWLTLGILVLCMVLLHVLSRNWGTAPVHPILTIENIELMNYLTAACVFMILSWTYSVSAMDLERLLLQKNAELEALSRQDPLTGLSNRRDVMDKIGYEKEKMIRNRYGSCFILADIDHFKKINDARGHNFGDFILTQISGILKSGVRKQDLVCRWGGEEFLLFLPHTDLDGGHTAAEKLRKSVEEFPFLANGKKMRVTLTFGVAVFDPAQEMDQSIKLADTRLYRGKANGRNRVESA